MLPRRKILCLIFGVLAIGWVCFVLQYDSIRYCAIYTQQIMRMMSWDRTRDVELRRNLTVEDEWSLHTLNMQHYKSSCSQSDDNPRYAWVTALNNDKYILPTLVLGHLLNRLSCLTNKIVLVSSNVSPLGRRALEAVEFQVQETDGLDCNYMDRIYNRSESNKGITGTHTRLLVFNLTRFDKVIYLDSDYFPTSPLDNLFKHVQKDKITAAYCSKPGVVDPCFNAGLVGLVPDTDTHSRIMEFWKSLSATDCPDDQRLLWWFFANNDNWIPLSYSYNVRRERYLPMRSFHFAGHGHEPRPWEWKNRPKDEVLRGYNHPLYSVMDIVSLWWKYLLDVIEEKDLLEFWLSVSHLTL